jgi:hypothetical protein
VLNSLSFTRDVHVITASVDDRPLNEALGYPEMYGLTDDEWRITARTLQGWMPQELGLERAEFVPAGKPIAGGRYVPVRPVKQVWVTLPGGDRPDVLADDVDTLVDHDSVPLLSCACGGGVGCAHQSVAITFERTRVHWHHRDRVLTFARAPYNQAIEKLLALLGEHPRLITDDEWEQPASTYVAP